MVLPLMPKATAVWLVENTALTFDQIAAFCQLHPLEVQAIADEEVAVGIVGRDPVANGELTPEEIKRCEADPTARLEMAEASMPRPATRTKGPRYTPVAKRQERPDAIAWLLRHYPELTDAQIGRLVGTTKSTINAVRDRTHWKGANIKPVDPVDIGMCSYEDLLAAVQTARRRKARAEQRATREAARREREAAKVTGAAAPPSAPGESATPASEQTPDQPFDPAPAEPTQETSEQAEPHNPWAQPSPAPDVPVEETPANPWQKPSDSGNDQDDENRNG